MNSLMETPAPTDQIAPAPRRGEALAGVLIGTAVGDALGLPMEGLSARRQQKLCPPPLKHRFIGPWGMISDDTEHTLMLAQALLCSPEDAAGFQRCLAHRFKWWLASLPAGVGFATLRAILRLWVGLPPNRSGVMSAGNGAAMRSALLGVYFSDDWDARRKFVAASTQITHRDPRAGIAALAVAETAAWMTKASHDRGELLDSFRSLAQDAEWISLVEAINVSLTLDHSVATFAGQIGAIDGVSGYAFQSIPVAIYAAIRHGDNFSIALTEVIACGGDTDTSAAITGALVGARVGTSGVPQPWRENIVEFPHSLKLLQAVADRLALQTETRTALGPCRYFWPAIPLRNLVFLGIVLAHGFRRLFPPY
jgi:ADP-ribosyl-[dinitrogen reductase] hydrolase